MPPLLLQPLVENAIRHGIATRPEGGVLRLEASTDGEKLRLLVENPFDPEAPSRPGVGLGLSNVRRRLLARYGEGARLDAQRRRTASGWRCPARGGGAVIDVLIVDDEEPARAVLREMLGEEPDVRILGECATGLEAVKAAAELKPQAIFLDIEMPKLDGFEVLELLDPRIAVVFVTAYDSHALRAFEVHAVDYVLKPFRAERLREALAARAGAGRPRPEPAVLAQAARPVRRIRAPGRGEGRRAHPHDPGGAPGLRAGPGRLRRPAQRGQDLLKTQTLGALEASLDPALFVRVHRSFLVRLDRIRAVEPYAKNSRAAVLRDGTRIPVSREGHARLKELLGGHGGPCRSKECSPASRPALNPRGPSRGGARRGSFWNEWAQVASEAARSGRRTCTRPGRKRRDKPAWCSEGGIRTLKG